MCAALRVFPATNTATEGDLTATTMPHKLAALDAIDEYRIALEPLEPKFCNNDNMQSHPSFTAITQHLPC
jgi:hypothetical protein